MFPAGLNASTCGAATHSERSSFGCSVDGRWTIQTKSCRSTATPAPAPMIHWFGSRLGQSGSTSNCGTSRSLDVAEPSVSPGMSSHPAAAIVITMIRCGRALNLYPLPSPPLRSFHPHRSLARWGGALGRRRSGVRWLPTYGHPVVSRSEGMLPCDARGRIGALMRRGGFGPSCARFRSRNCVTVGTCRGQVCRRLLVIREQYIDHGHVYGHILP